MYKKLNSAVLVFLGALLIIILAVIIAAMGRGFDFQDESFYLLCYTYPDVYKEGISSFHVIVNKLSAWVNPGVITYRLESLIATLASSFVLFWGFLKWLRSQISFQSYYTQPPFLLVYVFIANFIQYFVGLQTINYNILINALILCCSGMLLYLFSFDARAAVATKGRLALLLVIGTLCAFSFFIKFSTGILEVLAYSAVIIVYYVRQSIKARLMMIGTMLAGCIVGGGLYFLLFQGYADWSHNFLAGYREITKPTDHPPGLLLQSYIADIVSMVRFGIFKFYWLAILPALLLADARLRTNKMFVMARNAIVLLCAVWFCYRMYKMDFHRSNFIRNWDYRNGYFYPIVMGVAVALLMVAMFNKRVSLVRFARARYHLIIVALFCFFLPFLGAIGTSNPLFLNLLFNAAPWFCFLLILLLYVGRHIGYAVGALFIVITFSFTASQVVDGNIYAPYYTAFRAAKTNFFDQTAHATQVPKLNGTTIDTASNRFLNELGGLLKSRNFHERYPVWAFSSGITYLMGGIQIEVFWYNKTCDGVKYFNLDNRPPVFITSDDRPKINADLEKCLRSKGINYPEDYEFVGHVWFPHFQTMAKVFFPKNYK